MLEVSAFALLGVSPFVVGMLVTVISLVVPSAANFAGAHAYYDELLLSRRNDKLEVNFEDAVQYCESDFLTSIKIHESSLVRLILNHLSSICTTYNLLPL